MLSNLIFVLNGVTPIFIILAIGYFLRRKSFITEDFVKVADKLVFKLLLPVLLFSNVASMDRSTFDKNHIVLILYALLAVIISSFGLLAITTPLITDSAKRGAFVQGAYRSNTAVLGIPFAQNLFGDAGASMTAILIAFVVPLYNVIAVIILTMCDPDKGKDQKLSKKLTGVAKDIIKNPLIIGIALGLAVCFLDIELPIIARKTVSYLASASTPLALIAIGANFDFADIRERIGLTITASILKTAVIPMLVVVIGAFLGFEESYLGALFVIFGTPSAVSSYIMAKNMNNDYKLASQIIVTTTLLSAITVSLGSFMLFTSGLISR